MKDFRSGMKQANIAKKYSTSRQRIHQIVREYNNCGRKRGREKKYFLLTFCEICQNKAIHLHHRDFNNKNDDVSNLQPLCRKCHVEIHTKRNSKKWNKTFPYCIECGLTEYPYKRNGLCRLCFARSQNKTLPYEWSTRYPCCILCKTTDIKHISHGYCEKCFSRIQYSLYPERIERHKRATRKYYLSHKEERYLYQKQYLQKKKLAHKNTV